MVRWCGEDEELRRKQGGGDEEALKGKLHSCIGLWISIFLVIRLTASRVNESVLFFIAYFRNEEAQFGKVGQLLVSAAPVKCLLPSKPSHSHRHFSFSPK